MEQAKHGKVGVLVTYTETGDAYFLLPKIWSNKQGRYINDESKKDIPIKGDDIEGLIKCLGNLLHGDQR